MTLTHPCGTGITSPVLIDPVTQTVYRLPYDRLRYPRYYAEHINNEGKVRLQGLPLMDCPLIVTDERVLNTNESEWKDW